MAESYVIVRPPPSMSHDPRNLQVQLVAPRSHANAHGPPSASNSPRHSTDLTANTSARSFDAVAEATVGLTRSISASSVQSGHSTRSRSSSTTAASILNGSPGTASSSRRTIPMYNLSFHSVVLSTVVTDAGTDAKVAKFLKRGVDLLDLAVIDPVDISSSALKQPPPQTEPTPTTAPASNNEGRPGFLSKFKKLSMKPNNSPSSFAGGLLKSSNSNNSIVTADGQPIVPLFETNDSDAQSSQQQQAYPKFVPKGSKKAYRWTIRKWTRPDLVQRATPVRIEWTRTNRCPSSTKKSKAAPPSSTSLSPPSRQSAERTRRPSSAASSNNARLTPDTDRSRSPAPSGASADENDDDDGTAAGNQQQEQEEPDPEDDERVWICELIQGDKRVLLGSLSPAVHHPTMLAVLSVPATLAPFDLDIAMPNDATASLSVDELRDFVCVTSLWLVVRESIGGLARRKGDRWTGHKKVVPRRA